MSYGEIKKAVNSNLGKPLDVLIEEKTGAVNATGGTASAGGIFAKLNKLLTDWTTARAGKIDTIATDLGTVKTNVNTLVSGRVVKSVQYGFIDRTGQAIVASVTVSHSTVDISKSLIFIKGSSTYSDEGYDNIVVSRTSSNFVVKTSVPDTVKINGSLSWQVIEFY